MIKKPAFIKQHNTHETAGVPETQDAVKLRPLWGVRPGVYLAALYGVIILAVLFFILFYPGLRRPGIMLEAVCEPRGAAIRVDDVFYAAAPAKIFIPKGNHTVTVVMPGFEPVSTEIEAGTRLFASRFFPKTVNVSVKLEEKEPLAALKLGAADYAAWSFAGEPTIDYQIPLSLSEGVYRSAASLNDAEDILMAAARFMVTQAAAKDILRAQMLAAANGQSPSPLGLLEAARNIFEYMQNNPAFAVALAAILPSETAGMLIDSKLYPEVWTVSGIQNRARVTGIPVTVEGIPFSAEFQPGIYTQAASFQHEEKTGAFYFALQPVSYAQWQNFLRENPQWRLEERKRLCAEGWVTEDYLEPFASYSAPEDFYAEYPEYPAPAMSAISWYAACAFCEWLSAKLPLSLSKEYEVRLPSEAEWEYAARFAAPEYGESKRSFAGNSGLWEWCADPFVPLNYLAAPSEAKAALSSPERSIRGGSWVNVQDIITPQRRASLPPDSCSAFVGFRPVIAPKIPSNP